MPESPPEAPPQHPGVHYPPPILFVAGFFLGTFLERRWPTTVHPEALRPVAVVVAWGLVAVSTALVLWAGATFARHRTAVYPNLPARRLVTGGPYRYSRNPMYVGLTVLYLAGVLWLDTLWPLLLLPLVLALLQRAVIRREERYLAAAFGDDYREFRRSVPRWL